VLLHPRNALWSQPDVPDANRPVSQRQQTTARAPFIFHLSDGLLSATAVFSDRAFSHAGPSTWNSFLDNVHTVADPAKFQKLLKAHYFSAAFSIC